MSRAAASRKGQRGKNTTKGGPSSTPVVGDGTAKLSCVVLDLDESLVWTSDQNKDEYTKALTQLGEKRVYSFELKDKDDTYDYWGILRPYARWFVLWLWTQFDVVGVWSAGEKDYVEAVVKVLFIHRKPDFVWSRNECEKVRGVYYKPLSKLFKVFPSIDPTNTVILDDKRKVAKYNEENLIELPKWEPSTPVLYDRILIVAAEWIRDAKEQKKRSLVQQLEKEEIDWV